MLSRIVSGVILASAIVAILLLTPWWGLGIVVLWAVFQCTREFQSMARPDAPAWDKVAFTLAGYAVVAWPVIARYWPHYQPGLAFLIGFVLLATARLLRPLPIETAMQRLSLDALGLLYLGVTMPFIFLLRDRPGGGQVVILAMGVTFLSDTGGYVFGRLFGKHKLYPVVSPKKTVEGVMGGVLFATGTAFLARVLFPDLGHLTALDCIVLGVVGSAFAVTGDLVESLMKRAFGVKDSGTLIPGHGGLLDRIDALLFCGPFVWVYLELLGR
ncbi:MAG: phosphatidate cytidylyltransferase [Myxococcales bacterium]|nr:phosphatidate cytidylyltransferase [Myxococcales bacterium]